ncbi:FAD-binding domain-containing protein [Artomyces pyxidatus]|uniref:FAD-binding domain-containing protein n=1 Tax=Artomyces pyxidatus TaxID=48021 RepID=A0ACB8SU16_9AGAM|nr:FAD-binding domain-containing protein [Artomyces pyxidatus]
MSDFATFEDTFHGDIVTPTHPGYADALIRWAKNSQRNAAVVAFAKDTDDVRAALFYAKAQNLRMTVKGGGHNPAGSSSVEGGLVIDLSRYMADVRVDADAKLAYVGGGALWRTVNGECAKYGLVTPGGTVGHVGGSLAVLSALTLGGGYGFLTGQYGLVIDNLEKATVVLASGETVTASEQENADLFWAIRGGGSNFGVVTEFVFRLYPHSGNVFSGLLFLKLDALESVVRVIEKKWEAGMSEKEAYHLVITRTPEGTPCIVLILFFDGTESEGRSNFEGFFGLGPLIIVDRCKEMSYSSSNGLQDETLPHGRNYYLKSVSLARPSVEIAFAVRDAVYAQQKEHPDMAISFVFENWSLGKVWSVSDDATAFQRSKGLSTMLSIVYENDTPEGLQEVRKVAEAISGIVSGYAGGENVGYANYNSDAPSRIGMDGDTKLSAVQTQAYFGSNHVRLRELKKKYDPDMVFTKWFAIQPAV